MNPPSRANLFILNNITRIDRPAKGLSIYIHCAPRGTATARNLIQNEWYHITNVASLLLPCVSRYAAVAKNSHCTQSYSKCVESYHAHCLPREGLEYRHTLRPSRNSSANVNLHFKFYLKQEKKHENCSSALQPARHYKRQRRKSSRHSSARQGARL